MGMYIFISQWEREKYSKIHNDEQLDKEFQEARKYDNSILITENTTFQKHFWKPTTYETTYQVYHETHPNEAPYQAQYQMSGSGSKAIVTAYLHGIINGANSAERK